MNQFILNSTSSNLLISSSSMCRIASASIPAVPGGCIHMIYTYTLRERERDRHTCICVCICTSDVPLPTSSSLVNPARSPRRLYTHAIYMYT